QIPFEHQVDRVGVGSFREELLANLELLTDADALESLDIRLLERAEHVDDFLHGPLLAGASLRSLQSLQRAPLPPSRQSIPGDVGVEFAVFAKGLQGGVGLPD